MPKAKDNNGEIALILAGAFCYGTTEALIALLKNGANIEATDVSGSRGHHADPSDPDGRLFLPHG